MLLAPLLHSSPPLPGADDFIDDNCVKCHNDVDQKGGLDLTMLAFTPEDPANFATWVKVHDRLQAGEMPPKSKPRPDPDELKTLLAVLTSRLTAIDRAETARHGRASLRRLNRYEYENALRDLLQEPMLQIKDLLPEDGEAYRYNKSGEALAVSHVQMARFLNAADYAIRETLSSEYERPPTAVHRYYARDQSSITRHFLQSFQASFPEWSTTPLIGTQAQPEVHARRQPLTVGNADPRLREQEAVGWVQGYYQGSFDFYWNQFLAPVTGRYRVRISGYTIWVGPGGYRRDFTQKEGDQVGVPLAPRWFLPNLDDISPGRRMEPISVYAKALLMRRVGTFDLGSNPTVTQLDDVWLLRGDSIALDASRFFRGRQTPKEGQFTNPLAQPDGQPGVAFRWVEVEGPLYDTSAQPGYRLLFGDLPLQKVPEGGAGVSIDIGERPPEEMTAQAFAEKSFQAPKATVAVVSTAPDQDAERLLQSFLQRAYLRPATKADVQLFLGLVHERLKAGRDFTSAMVAAYTAILCSPKFLYVEAAPGRLDDYALAQRLALFLWNSSPDAALRAHAAAGDLHRPDVLQAEAMRLLDDPKSSRFVEAFLNYWLDLRRLSDTDPSATLYPDYYLDEGLTESALEETRLYFSELLRRDLPARDVIDSDFAFLNERLARHYQIPGVTGVELRRVTLPPNSLRGGMMTQASVLKLTANGTTTSPVIRGHFITERLLGIPTPPPPSVPAVTPDLRGAVTIREQLARHRSDPSCAVCHSKMDPAGFALESFDVMGGWRDRYRGISDDELPATGIGHNGFPFTFYYALPVDSTGELPDGRRFQDVRELKRLLLQDPAQIARNLAQQLVVYATGTPVRFSDRPDIENILRITKSGDYGVRSLVLAVVQSDLFLNR